MSKTKYHYVYKILFESGHFYYGKRSTFKLPEKDTKYWGSPVTHKDLWKDQNNKKTKIIIDTFTTEEEALKYEGILIGEAWKHSPEYCLNMTSYTDGKHPDLNNHIRSERGTFKSKYPNLGKTDLMRVPESLVKGIERLLLVCDKTVENGLDVESILTEEINKIKTSIK